jgi:hypothetical protein
MTKVEIKTLLQKKHDQFLSVFPSITETSFNTSVNGKWSPGQQLDHIIRSVEPVVFAFTLPSFVPPLFFGRSNRPSRTYEALIEKYHSKLASGGKASGRFIPQAIAFEQRESAMEKLRGLIRKLNLKVELYSEQQLDTLLLPHPLLGKLTFREMLYFTAYHAEHHEMATKRNLA